MQEWACLKKANPTAGWVLITFGGPASPAPCCAAAQPHPAPLIAAAAGGCRVGSATIVVTRRLTRRLGWGDYAFYGLVCVY
eukprot:SAG31_NODE_26939_length_434_cov_0.552239_1_plen_81_part_00